MPQINCYIPIKLRLVGEPSEAQLEQLGQTLVRTLQERLAFAERTLLSAHAGLGYAGDREVLREDYDPSREDVTGQTYTMPSYRERGQPASVPLRTPSRGRPWFIRRAINFHAYVGQFLELWESWGYQGPDTAVDMDLLQEQRWISLWLVQVNQSMLRSNLMQVLAARVHQLNRAHNQLAYYAISGDEKFRQQLIEIDLDHIVAREIPALRRQTGTVEAGGDIRFPPGSRVLFANMMLPKIVLQDRADLGVGMQVTVGLRDLTFVVNPVGFDRFERRFGLSWEIYLRVFGDQPAFVHIQPLTVRKRTHISTLTALVEQAVGQRLAAGPETVVYSRLDVLNSAALGQWPPIVRDIGNRLSDDITRRLDKTQTAGDLEPNWKMAYVYTGLVISPKSVETARYRPGVGHQADLLIPLIRDRLVTVSERWAFIDFIKHNFSSFSATPFEVLLDELKRRENGRWFDRLFRATEEALDYEVRLLVIRLVKQTHYANDPAVLGLVSYHNQVNRQLSTGNVYNVADQKVILNKLFGDKTVSVNDVFYDVYDTYVHEEKRYKPKPLYAPIWAAALLREAIELIDRIEKGEDSQGLGSGYTDTEFAEAVLKAVFSRIHITEDNYGDYFDTVTVQLSVRFMGLKKCTDELGIETITVLYRVVEREGGGSWKDVGEVLEARDADFDYMIDRWVHEHVSSAIITITHISLAIAAIGVAWEFRVIQTLTRIAGGARVVIPSMILTAFFESIINGFTFENFLLGAIDGYLGALFFRGAGVLARGIFGRSITSVSFREGLLRWIGAQIFKGVVGGGGSGGAMRFTHDVYLVATGRGKWSSPAEYAKSIGWGAAIGVGMEFAGPLVLEPVLGKLAGGAVDVAKLLRANGISAERWQAWAIQAQAKIKRSLNELLESEPGRAINIQEGFRLLYEQIGEAYAGLGGALRGRVQLAVFRQLLEFSGAELSGSAAKGLEKLLTAAELNPSRALSLFNALADNPQQVVAFLELANGLEQSSIRRVLSSFSASNTAQIQEQVRILLQSGPARESLASFLDLVWANRQQIISEGDSEAVYRLYSRATVPNPLTRSPQEYLDEIAEITQGRPQGAVSNIQGNPIRGFHRFERAGADLSAIQERIYLNVKADQAPEVMRFVVRDIVDNTSQVPGVGMAKLTGPGAISGRADAIVIYAENQAAVQNVLERIRSYHTAHPEYFQSTTPPMTNRVMDGVSVGAEPLGVGGRASFGSIRSDLIYEALDQAVFANETRQQFRELVLTLFQRRGINPEAPHLNLPVGGNP